MGYFGGSSPFANLKPFCSTSQPYKTPTEFGGLNHHSLLNRTSSFVNRWGPWKKGTMVPGSNHLLNFRLGFIKISDTYFPCESIEILKILVVYGLTYLTNTQHNKIVYCSTFWGNVTFPIKPSNMNVSIWIIKTSP